MHLQKGPLSSCVAAVPSFASTVGHDCWLSQKQMAHTRQAAGQLAHLQKRPLQQSMVAMLAVDTCW